LPRRSASTIDEIFWPKSGFKGAAKKIFGPVVTSPTGIYRDDIEPRDLLRALTSVAHVRPGENWKRSAVRMIDILLKSMEARYDCLNQCAEFLQSV
jgi:hypothetical protein